ncbi:MAG: glycerol-3-phosphate 1-O-acyltransferase PlsY [Hyphomicrobiaceae bacterium]
MTFTEFFFSPETWLALALGYALGAMPFGLLLTQAAGLGDIRDIGSGNIGATNVLRTGNKKLAAATLLLDLLKGTIAVLLARHLLGGEYALTAGVAAFFGHIAPIWLGFRGGKGVATYLGVLFGWWWIGGLVFAATWLIVAYLKKYSSLAALVGSIVSLIAIGVTQPPFEILLIAIITLLLIVKHHANIRRLFAGEEPKISEASAK